MITHNFDPNTRIEFIENHLQMYSPMFISYGREERIPLLLEVWDVEDALLKMKLINIQGFSFEAAKMVISGELRIAKNKHVF